jgi:hypothetical protein
MLDLTTLLRSVVMLGRLVDRIRVRHAENSRTELLLVVIQNIRKILVLQSLLSSNTFGRIVG